MKSLLIIQIKLIWKLFFCLNFSHQKIFNLKSGFFFFSNDLALSIFFDFDFISTFQDVDTMAFPRIVYAVFIVLFLLIGVVAYLLDHVVMHNIAVAAKVKKTYTF